MSDLPFVVAQETDDCASSKALKEFFWTKGKGLANLIHSTGHGWSWGHEVFAELFVELYARRTHSRSLDVDKRTFDSLFKSVWAELSRKKVTIRQVIAFSGTPIPKAPLRLAPGVSITPYDLNSSSRVLWDLLSIPHQRDYVSKHPDGTGILICTESIFEREPSGRRVLEVWDALEQDYLNLILALRLQSESPVMIQTIYSAQVSKFPLFPLTQDAGRDYRKGFYTSHYEWKPALTKRLRITLRDIHGGTLDQFGLLTPAERFLTSFRFSEHRENTIDLIVCLEGVLDVGGTEMRHSLASRAAALLGDSDSARVKIYEHVSCAYRIRNRLVHAGSDPNIRIRKDLKKLFAHDETARDLNGALRPLVLLIQSYAAEILNARMRAGDE